MSSSQKCWEKETHRWTFILGALALLSIYCNEMCLHTWITEGIFESFGGKKWSKRFVISVTVQTKLALRLKPNYVSVNLYESDSRKITGLFHQSGEEHYITENWVINELRPWLLHFVCDEENIEQQAKRSYSNYKGLAILSRWVPTKVDWDYCESTLFSSCVVNFERILVPLPVSQMKALFLEVLLLDRWLVIVKLRKY